MIEREATGDKGAVRRNNDRRRERSDEFQLISFNQRKGLNSFNEINANGAKGGMANQFNQSLLGGEVVGYPFQFSLS